MWGSEKTVGNVETRGQGAKSKKTTQMWPFFLDVQTKRCRWNLRRKSRLLSILIEKWDPPKFQGVMSEWCRNDINAVPAVAPKKKWRIWQLVRSIFRFKKSKRGKWNIYRGQERDIHFSFLSGSVVLFFVSPQLAIKTRKTQHYSFGRLSAATGRFFWYFV